jgi:hypothetical protein
VDREAKDAKTGLDAAAKQELLAEDCRLQHFPFCPQHKLIAVPSFVTADQACWQAADAPVRAVWDCLPDVRLVEVLCRVPSRDPAQAADSLP